MQPRIGAGVLIVFTGLAAAQVPLPVQSYSMRNGMAGTLSYFDDSYNGAGNNSSALSPLSGGTGDLTDGVIPLFNWNITPGPYVGWQDRNEPITFFFGDVFVIDSVRVHFDVSGAGGVAAPLGFDIDYGFGGQSFAVPAPVGLAPTSVLLQLDPGTIISEFTLTPSRGGQWTMLSEVEVFTIPAPSTTCVLAGASLAARRKRD